MDGLPLMSRSRAHKFNQIGYCEHPEKPVAYFANYPCWVIYKAVYSRLSLIRPYGKRFVTKILEG